MKSFGIEWVLLAEYAQVKSNVATIVGAGIDSIVAPRSPDAPDRFEVDFVVVMKWTLAKHDLGGEVELALAVLDPDARVIGEQTRRVVTVAGADLSHHGNASFLHHFPLRVLTPTTGEHIVEIGERGGRTVRTYVTVKQAED